MRRMAGRLRLDPNGFTLRELAEMDEAHAMEAWDHTTAIQAIIINCRPFKKSSKWVKPEQLHPIRRKQKRGISPTELAARLEGNG